MIGLRINDKHNQSYLGFQYPTSGEVEALDWDPRPVCGQGLHFFKDGEGDGFLISDEVKDPEAIWLIVEADDQLAVDLGGKYKAPKLKVLEAGPKEEILKKLRSLVGPDKAIMYATEEVGDHETIVVGYGGAAVAGCQGTAKAGIWGRAIARRDGKAEAEYRGTAETGDWGEAKAGNRGEAKAGDYGTASAGRYGTATVGDFGIATVGFAGCGSAGVGGTITFNYHNGGSVSFPVDGKKVKAGHKYSLGGLDGCQVIEVFD